VGPVGTLGQLLRPHDWVPIIRSQLSSADMVGRFMSTRPSPFARSVSFGFLGLSFKKFCASVNYLTLGLRKNMRTPIGKLNAT
jgi:hypothetical protein